MKFHVEYLLHPANILAFICVAIIAGAFVFYELPSQGEVQKYIVELEGRIVEYPDRRADKTILVIEPSIKNIGRIRITTDNLRNYLYGEIVKVKGTVKEPENFADFNWRGYLAKEGVYYTMYKPEIKSTGIIEEDILHYSGKVRQKMQTNINNSLLPPNSSLYSAMVLGNKSYLSQKQKDNLASAGLSHIAAISGMHIATILFVLLGLFLRAGMWRRQAAILALAFITFYILVIGAPASAMRAGIMAGVLILGWLFGRPNFSWRALLIAGAVMVLFNPYIVRYDIGFQLSFLAVLGILLFFEKIEFYLKKLQYKIIEFISRGPVTKDRPLATYMADGKFGFISILAVTLSAQALTFPLIIYNFGSFSLVSPLTNLLVVPLLPAVLVSGFIAAITPTAAGIILSAPAWMFSEYIWAVVGVFS